MLSNPEYENHTSISCLRFCSGGGGLPGQGDCGESDSLCTTFLPPMVPILPPIPPIFAPWRFRVGGGDEGGIQGDVSTGLEEPFKGLPCLQEAVLDSVERSDGGKNKEGIGDLACL